MRSFAMLMLVGASALVCAAAQTSKQEQEVGRLLSMMQPSDYDSSAPRNLDALGGPNLVRDARGAGAHSMHYFPRMGIDSISGIGFGANKRSIGISRSRHPEMQVPTIIYGMANSNKLHKRNFDEIDRAGFDRFVKRNFDELDGSSFNSLIERSPAEYVAIPHYAYQYYENQH